MNIILDYMMVLASLLFFINIGYVLYKLTFWCRLGVPGPIPIPIFGNWLNCVLGRLHPAEQTKRFYDEYKDEKMVGIYQNLTPRLIIRDRDLIKDVLVRDFNTFSSRGVDVYERVEPLSHHLFTMKRELWSLIRSRLSPAFNIVKLKDHCDFIMTIAEEFADYIGMLPDPASGVDCIDAFTRFMNEVLGRWGLQLRMNQFSSESTTIQEINRFRHTSSVFNFSRRLLRENLPCVYKWCSKIFRNEAIISYYIDKLRSIEQFRRSQSDNKRDYVGLLLELKNETRKIGKRYLSEELTAAQIYLLFTAGAESTALVISKAIYEIAKNCTIQNTLLEEVTKVFEANSKVAVFEKLKKLKYLDKVFQETLRKYPLRNIIRISTDSYKFRGTNVRIPRGTRIIVPMYGIHHDPQIFADPNTFDPERFDEKREENKSSMIPFGLGPRYCVGSKLAEIIIKIVLAVVVKKFKLSIDESYTLGRNYARRTFLEPVTGIRVRFEKRTE